MMWLMMWLATPASMVSKILLSSEFFYPMYLQKEKDKDMYFYGLIAPFPYPLLIVRICTLIFTSFLVKWTFLCLIALLTPIFLPIVRFYTPLSFFLSDFAPYLLSPFPSFNVDFKHKHNWQNMRCKITPNKRRGAKSHNWQKIGWKNAIKPIFNKITSDNQKTKTMKTSIVKQYKHLEKIEKENFSCFYRLKLNLIQ